MEYIIEPELNRELKNRKMEMKQKIKKLPNKYTSSANK